jgi:hypothetical protein
MDNYVAQQMGGWMYKYMDEWVDGSIEKHTDGCR